LISINGEFDLAGVIEIGEELLEATSGSFTSLTLHLRGVEFIDSSGAATIAEIASRLGAEGKPIKLGSATRSVLRVLRILGVDQLMSLDPHLHEWRPMIPSAPSEARRSPTYAYVRADKAGEIAARNQDCSEQTDQASIRKIALAASSRDREKAPSAG
jgi:anti-anti-sigma factor